MTKNTPYELSLVVLVKNWFYIIMASEKCAGKFFLPGRVPGRVPGVFGLCRDPKKLCRDLKNISQFHKLGIHVIQLAVSLWVFSSHSVNSF